MSQNLISYYEASPPEAMQKPLGEYFATFTVQECSVYTSAMAGFSISRIITEFPLVQRKVFPLGSPPNTSGVPRAVLGKAAKTYSEDKREQLKAIISSIYDTTAVINEVFARETIGSHTAEIIAVQKEWDLLLDTDISFY